jgi:hypothetical protein
MRKGLAIAGAVTALAALAYAGALGTRRIGIDNE